MGSAGTRARAAAAAVGVAALWLLLGLPGCAGGTRPVAEPPSVLWIVLDAAGARHFGAYGNERATTPRIDAFATGATRFTRAYSQAAWTLPSAFSYLTGRYPSGYLNHGRLLPGDTLAALLRARGYATAAFSENPYVTRSYGFEAGFDEFRELFPYEVYRATSRAYRRVDSERTVAEVVARLQRGAGHPFFVYVHLLPPHNPYDPPAPFAGRFADPAYEGPADGSTERLLEMNEGGLRVGAADLAHIRALYHENLAFADDKVGRILDALDEHDLTDHTVVVLTSDHGEAFGEHGHLLHGDSVYEELIAVPLIVRLPPRLASSGGLGAWLSGLLSDGTPRTCDEVVQLVDLFPTVAALAGADPGRRPGRNLLGLLRDCNGGETSTALPAFSWSNRGTAAVVSDRWKLIIDLDDRSHRLFDLGRDPGERTDLAARFPERVTALHETFETTTWSKLELAPGTVDEETQKRLRALGYR